MDSESPLQFDVSSTLASMQPVSDFLKQAGEAQTSLRQFLAVKELKDCDPFLISALNKLIKDTVAYYFIGIISVISDFLNISSSRSRISLSLLSILYFRKSYRLLARLSNPSNTVMPTFRFLLILAGSKVCMRVSIANSWPLLAALRKVTGFISVSLFMYLFVVLII